MWLSCKDNPPPYGVTVTIRSGGSATNVSTRYARHEREKKNGEFTDYWQAEGGTGVKHNPSVLHRFDWEASEDMELFEEE